LYSPTGVSYATTNLLAAVTTNGLGYSYNFTYDTTLNDGDLTEAQFPHEFAPLIWPTSIV
jgi:hypothetical protein